MAKKQKTKIQKNESQAEFILKLICYFILGSMWVRFYLKDSLIGLPIGLLVGLILNTNETFQIDRKIEVAVLLIATFISFFLPLGIMFEF